MLMEQRVISQQDQIQLHMETIKRQREEIQFLIQQRDRYRAERDTYRNYLYPSLPLPQVMSRSYSSQSPPVLSIETYVEADHSVGR